MDWLQWLDQNREEIAWHVSAYGRSAKVPVRLNRRLPHKTETVVADFKIDTGSPETIVPYDLVRQLIPDYSSRERVDTGLKNLRLGPIRGVRYDDLEIEISMPLTSRGVSRIKIGLWVTDEARGGLLGMSFLRKFGLVLFNFDDVHGPYDTCPHFGLIEKPEHPLLLTGE